MEQLAKEFKVNCTYVSTIDQSKLAVLQDTRAFMWNAWNLADIICWCEVWQKINSLTNTNTKNANSAFGTTAADWLITVQPT